MKFNKNYWRPRGFTLVEIMVVVASVGVIMTSVIGVVLSTFRVQNREKSNNKVVENGSRVVNELRKNILNSGGESIVCAADGLSVEVINVIDQNKTTLSCNKTGNKIASASATKESVLNSGDVNITDCNGFISCELDDSGNVSSVTFNFGIGATTTGVSANENFKTTVTVRN